MVIVAEEGHRNMPSTSFRINPEYAQMVELVPGLYICGVSSLTPDNMERYNISLIINATNEVPNIRSLGEIPRMKLWLDDTSSTNIYEHLDLISDQIEAVIAGGGNVLVHCVAGVSRSATICLAFLTKFRCSSLRQAYYLMARKRPLVRPNIGFWRQLITYEQEVKNGATSVKLVRDENDAENTIPDVYVTVNDNEQSFSEENVNWRRGRRFSGDKPKFQPVLEKIPESVEAAA